MDSLQRQASMIGETARIVANTFNMIQEALGSPTRIILPSSLQEEQPETEEVGYEVVEEEIEEEEENDTCENCDGDGFVPAGYQSPMRIDPKMVRCSYCRGTGKKL